MFVYIYAYIYIYKHTYIYTYAYIYKHTYIYTYAYTAFIYIYTYIIACSTFLQTNTYIYIYIYLYIHRYIHTYIYIYIYIYTYTTLCRHASRYIVFIKLVTITRGLKSLCEIKKRMKVACVEDSTCKQRDGCTSRIDPAFSRETPVSCMHT